jgi:Protein of unknown function (DUF4238)
MAARRQHHVPQILQRGFGTRKGKEAQIYIYSKNKPTFLTGTNNYGVEGDFYSIGSDNKTDLIVTEFEAKSQDAILFLQSGGNPEIIGKGTLSDIITHLETRTKFLREEFAFTSQKLVDELSKLFSNKIILSQILKSYLSKNPTILREYLDKISLDKSLQDFLMENSVTLLSDTIDQQAKSMANNAKFQFFEISSTLIKAIREAHIKSIREIGISEIRSKRYAQLTFRICEISDGELVLGDTMVAFLTKSRLTPFLDKNDKLEAVWLPVTSNRILIGESGPRVDRTTVEIVRILASTSYKSFIAKSNSEALNSLTPRIGRNAQIISRADTESIKRHMLDSLIK